MCVIIHRPKNVEIPLETLEQCWSANSDGAGLSYVQTQSNGVKQLVVHKGLMTFEDFYKLYKKLNCYELLIHFRLASAGSICERLTHPFSINPNLAVMHNGHLGSEMINHFLRNEHDTSDTKVFVDKILKLLPDDFLYNEGIVRLINDCLGGSVMVFMDISGKITILGNHSQSVIIDGCWYSNNWWFMAENDFKYVQDNILEEFIKGVSNS